MSGYDTTADIAQGDEVEVHGFWYHNADGNPELVSTRFEKMAPPSMTRLLITGLLASPTPACDLGLPGTSTCLILRINAASDPADSGSGTWLKVTDSRCLDQLEFGEAVQVTVSRTDLTTLAAHSSSQLAPVTALSCKRSSLRATEVSGGVLKISGLPSTFDSDTNMVRINGTSITLTAPTSDQVQAIQGHAYVAMSVEPGQSKLSTRSLELRDLAPGSNDVTGLVTRISGVMVNPGFDGTSPVIFTLRNVEIEAASEVLDAGCRGARSGVNLKVSVQGRVSASGRVTARAVSCTTTGTGS